MYTLLISFLPGVFDEYTMLTAKMLIAKMLESICMFCLFVSLGRNWKNEHTAGLISELQSFGGRLVFDAALLPLCGQSDTMR